MKRLVASGIDDLSIYEIEARARALKIAPVPMLPRYCPGIGQPKSKTTPIPTLGFSLPVQPTSMTIGINPQVVKERIPLLLDGSRFKSLK